MSTPSRMFPRSRVECASTETTKLPAFKRSQYPGIKQAIHRPLGRKPRLVHAAEPERAATS